MAQAVIRRLSLQRYGARILRGHLRYVMNKVAFAQNFIRVLRFYLVSVLHQCSIIFTHYLLAVHVSKPWKPSNNATFFQISRSIAPKSTRVLIKITVFWDVTPCGLVARYTYFRETYCLHRNLFCICTVFWDVTPCGLVARYTHLRGTYCLHRNLFCICSKTASEERYFHVFMSNAEQNELVARKQGYPCPTY
jgi:hypothetical protein